ncbi:hypothetical protein ACSHWB_31960 [Lentzea sp. HUAS TT2]|uniref:hypothetical protein n=1 Tax=Lentzea sp. HUAS TT2 TaxID=3447454 RepID=UPI003F72EE62
MRWEMYTWSAISRFVSPETTKNVATRYKTGSSQHWCGIQVLDHRNPWPGWRSRRAGGNGSSNATRTAGCGGSVAITDVHGERLVVNALPVRPDAVQPTNVQFTRAGE